jgi:hypothetical protein
LADRTNRGIIVVNATSMTYKTLMKPVTTGTPTKILNSIGAIIGYKTADPTGGFIGASIYATGPSNQGTGRIGNVEEVNSGPGGMAVYENPGDPNDHRWMLVTDGACQINNNGGGYSSPAAGGSMRSCSTPADASVAGAPSTFAVCASASCATQTLTGPAAPFGTTHGVTNYVSKLNPLLNTANCTNPGPQYLTSAGLPVKTVCYPQNHQSNVKLFDLKTNTWVATFPTGGGCVDNGYQNAVGGGLFQVLMAPCTAPLGLYAPPSAAAPYGYSLTGLLGKSGSFDVKIGVDSHDGQVYVLVTNPDENSQRMIGCQLSQVIGSTCAEPGGTLGPATGATGGCSENAPPASNQSGQGTFIQPWDDVTPTAQTAAYPGSPGPVGIQGQVGLPYMTLFTMDPTTGYLYYSATIRIDEHQSTNGPAIPPGVAGTNAQVPAITSVLPNARQMVVESGFRGCDNKGRHGPESFGGIAWSPQAGVGGAFMVTIPNVLNNPPICYIASLDNLCGPPTTNPGTTTIITAANASTMATIPPGPGAFSQNFMGQSYIPGPWLGCDLATGQGPGCVPSQGGDSATGGCNYPAPTPPPANLIGSINNQANGGFEWVCDGALAMIDPVYVYKGPKQPNILTQYPMYHTTTDPASAGTVPANGFYVPVGSPMDGITDANNTYPRVLAACPHFNTAVGLVHNPLLPAPGGAATCPNGLVSPGPAYPGPVGPLPQGIVFQPTAGSIGGVVYLPYCSPSGIELGPTDIPGGWDGAGAGDVSSLTASSTGRTSTFANIFLGCDPHWNGNFGTGQGQLTVNIQENYSLALNTLSATSNPAFGCTLGVLGVGCRSVSHPQAATITNPFVPPPVQPNGLPTGPIGLNGGFNDFYLPGPFPAVDPLPLFAHYNPNVNTPVNAGCTAQYPAVPPANGGGTCGGMHPFVPPNAVNGPVCSTTTCAFATGNQVMGGTITGPNIFNAGVQINGVTEARFNMSNAKKDPHWWVVAGGRGWTAGSIAGALPSNLGLATRAPVIAYIDALTNVNVEYIPTSSGSDTIALDEQNYVAFVPVNGVQNSTLPHGDFTGNGTRLCGNTTTRNGLTTGPGCIVVYKQQYLSPLGGGPVMGN